MLSRLLLCFFGLFSQGRGPIETSLEGAENSAERCRECHAEEYEEWRKSRHSQAFSNDFFQFDYRANKRQWCRNCHIPLKAQQGDDGQALALRDEGVNCIACHLRGQTFYAKSKRPNSPHPTEAIPTFGDESFCEACHQFSFPVFDQGDQFLAYTHEPMQNTVAEFRAGPFAGSHTCRDCHARSPAGHLYPGAHDLEMLREALSFRACRSEDQITTVLTNVGAAHNVPTGDVHRHLLVKAWRSTAPERLVEAFYGRRFKPLAGGGKTTIWDSSLPPNTYRRWQFDPARLGSESQEEINIEVRYVYGSRESYPPPFDEAAYQVVFRVRRGIAAFPEC